MYKMFRISLLDYCRMANFSVSFISPFFPESFQPGINNTGKKQCSTCPDVLNTQNRFFKNK